MSIILQNMAQLKVLFENSGRALLVIAIHSCIFGAMNSQHINMFLNCWGKETIDLNTFGKSTGRKRKLFYQLSDNRERTFMTPGMK